MLPGRLYQRKKASYVDTVKKPPLTGGNSVPINLQKEWRSRIILDNPSRPTHKRRSSVCDKLGPSTSKQKNLIPRKSVFSRIQFDLSKAEAHQATAKGNHQRTPHRHSVFDRLEFLKHLLELAKNKD
jgi:hypothetical protein